MPEGFPNDEGVANVMDLQGSIAHGAYRGNVAEALEAHE